MCWEIAFANSYPPKFRQFWERSKGHVAILKYLRRGLRSLRYYDEKFVVGRRAIGRRYSVHQIVYRIMGSLYYRGRPEKIFWLLGARRFHANGRLVPLREYLPMPELRACRCTGELD